MLFSSLQKRQLEFMNEPYLELSTISSMMSTRNGESTKLVDFETNMSEVADNDEANRESAITKNHQWTTSSADPNSLLERNKEEWKLVSRMVDKYLCIFVVVSTVIVLITLSLKFSYK